MKNLYSTVKVMEDFIPEGVMLGSGGYVMATMQLSMDYVRTAKLDLLQDNASQYERRVSDKENWGKQNKHLVHYHFVICNLLEYWNKFTHWKGILHHGP